MSLPLQQTNIQPLSLMQTTWKAQLDPVIANVLTSGQQLTGIKLANGITVVNHLLSRQMQGWCVTDVDGAATIYRSQPFNATTLTLTSNAAVTVNLWVF